MNLPYWSQHKFYDKKNDQRKAAKIGEIIGESLGGVRAIKVGKSPMSCPFILGTREHFSWMVGWLAGFDRRFT